MSNEIGIHFKWKHYSVKEDTNMFQLEMLQRQNKTNIPINHDYLTIYRSQLQPISQLSSSYFTTQYFTV
jgi:hypothetical protein